MDNILEIISPSQIAGMIDHSVLHPTMTDQDLILHCQLAQKYEVATVCVKPYHVPMAQRLLKDSKPAVCAVVGFPSGSHSVDMKVRESLEVISQGASEVDMVVNVGMVLQEDWVYISKEVSEVNKACLDHGAILKVIFETDFLPSDKFKISLCEICSEVGVAFVKTSTGFGYVKQPTGDYNYTGATPHDIALMRKHCTPNVQVKASGGVRNLDQVLQMIAMGATRIGTSSTEQILVEAADRMV